MVVNANTSYSIDSVKLSFIFYLGKIYTTEFSTHVDVNYLYKFASSDGIFL